MIGLKSAPQKSAKKIPTQRMIQIIRLVAILCHLVTLKNIGIVAVPTDNFGVIFLQLSYTAFGNEISDGIRLSSCSVPDMSSQIC